MPTILQDYPLANADEALEKCGYSYDSMFIVKKRKDGKRGRLFKEYFGIKIPQWKKPKFENGMDKLEIYNDDDILRNFGGNNDKCVIMYQPFKNVVNLNVDYKYLRF